MTVDPTEDLADSDTVTVTVSGIPPDQGIYVQLCARPDDGSRASGAACDGQGQGESGVWVVPDYPYPGEAPDGVADPDDGPFELQVHRTFHDVDCARQACGIQTRRDHRAGGDTSFDTFTPVTFASASDAAALPDGTDGTQLPSTGGGVAVAAAGVLVAALARRRREAGR